MTSIGQSAFEYCSGLTSVTIPNSVTSIGKRVFSGCSGLTSIKVESGNPVYDSRNNCNAIIESKTNTLVAGCANTTIPISVTSIGSEAFYACDGLTDIDLPNSLTIISDDAFFGCKGLTNVNIPNSVTSIGSGAFENCFNLSSVQVSDSTVSIGRGAFSATLWLRNQPDGLVYAGKVAYVYKGTMPESSTISLEDGTIGIADNAFSGCSGLTSVTIPNSVTRIGNNAFSRCTSLTSVTIPNSVTSIGDYAFLSCTGLESATFHCKVIESFRDLYNLKNIVLGEEVISISSNAFYGCSGLTSVTIPNSVTTIGEYAFSGCKGLTSLTVPNSVTSIGNGAFRSCIGLKEVNFNATNCSCTSSPFYECTSITTVKIGDNVQTIPRLAFYSCSGLTSVTIGNSVTSIGSSAFSGCKGLTSVTIPNSVKIIDRYAFSGCKGLTTVFCKASEIPNNYGFDNNLDCTLYVPIGCKESYIANHFGNQFKEIIEVAWADSETTYDVNNNGCFDDDDVSSLVGKVLGRADGTESAAYSFDANKDDKVDITDVVQVIGLINDIQQGNLPETDDENEGGYEEPTETEQQVMQMSSDEEGDNETVYSQADSLEYAALAQEVISRYDTDEDDDYNTSESRMLRSSMDNLAQEAIRMNGYNRFNSQLEIEQQNWDSKRWGSTRYGGFKTFYNTMEKNGKRYLLVVFYYKGGFPNKKTAYLKLGQLNSGKIICKAPIYTGQEFAALSVCIDDYLQDYGCFNVFPLLITEESKARNYLNPFLVKGKPIVDNDWRSKYYGYEFGKINGVSVYFNGDSKNGNNNQGNKWYQCVELCKRYVKELNSNINRKESDAWGNAINWPANRANDAKDPGKYLVFANDGREQVREGDLIIWNHGAYGHIGVVIKTAKDYISVAHQNGGTGTYASPIGTTMKLENGVIKDIKPGTNRSPIYKSIQTIPYFIRINSAAEKMTSYSASLRASTTNIAFAPTQVGKSVTKSIKIANSKGTGPLTVSSITLSKGEVFSVDASSFTISPGETHTFKVTFTPSSSGEFKDRIVIRSNADDNPTWVIHLSGSGT